MPDLAYVNGKVTKLADARVSVQDRGFLLADGVYEVMRTYHGEVFEFVAHLDRLAASCAGVRLRMPLAPAQVRRVIEALIRRSGYREARIYVQVTRGVAPRQHAFPRRARPTLVVYVERAPRRTRLGGGVAAITMPDPRARRCDLKTIALLHNVLAKQRAVEAGVREAIFIGPRGTVREGSTANIFMVRDRVIWTHPLGPEILPGVSRAVVLELARAAGVRVREVAFGRHRLYAADEVFLSSTMQEVTPLVRIDGRKIGTGRPGPIATLLQQHFHARTLAHGKRVRMRLRAAEIGRRR